MRNGRVIWGPADVQSYLQTGGHGKLIINDALYPIAYGEFYDNLGIPISLDLPPLNCCCLSRC